MRLTSPIWFCMSRSWDTFTASVRLIPGATFVMRRSLPAAPTETVLAWSAIEYAPNATERFARACAPAPSATASLPEASASLPIATVGSPVALAL
ncbi:hypothetical protein SAMN04515619_1447 [Collimonas sp. OK412]|nr:hypothetical protein SAMN04515619_1447 [Collimonas sp. OK412]